MDEQGKTLARYDDLANRHDAAYDSYERIYAKQHPMPIKPKSVGIDGVVVLTLILLVAASVIVSGSRTVIEFGGGFVGGSAFVMLELGIIGYAYIGAKRDPKNHDRTVKRLTRFGIVMAFIVALSANIHATLKQHGVIVAFEIDTAILLFVAISAPTLAYIAGELLGIEAVAGNRRQSDVAAEYARQMMEWRDGLNRAFDSRKGRLGVRVEMEPEPALPAPSVSVQRPNGQSGHGHGYVRESKASVTVRQHLDSSPQDASLTVRELAEKIGVGKSTVATVLKQWSEQHISVGGE